MQRRRILGILVAMPPAWAFGDETRIWQEYLEWFRAQEGTVPDPLTGFEQHLLRSGRSSSEANAAARIAARLMKERRDEWQAAFFDKTYSNQTPRFNTQPNQLLVETVKGLKPGRALDIHMGQGRNAIYLAVLGWQVTGFDYSSEGIAAALVASKAAGVKIRAVKSRHEEFEFGLGQWDLIIMSYTWLPLEAQWVTKVTQALAPGGILVFEHLMEESGSPGAATWLPRPNELPRLFAQLRILRYEDIRARPDWSWRPERIARLVAERDLTIEQMRLEER